MVLDTHEQQSHGALDEVSKARKEPGKMQQALVILSLS